MEWGGRAQNNAAPTTGRESSWLPVHMTQPARACDAVVGLWRGHRTARQAPELDELLLTLRHLRLLMDMVAYRKRAKGMRVGEQRIT